MIARFVFFDILNFATPVKRVAPSLFLVLVAPWAAPTPAFGIGAAAIVMSLLASNPFAADERGRLDTLYATLPLTRRDIVVGRYLALIVVYLVAAALASAAAVVVQIKSGQAVDPLLFGAVNVFSLLFFAVAISLQLPFFFSVGFTRARLMSFIPAAVLVGGAALAAQLGALNSAGVIEAVSHNLATLWIVAPIAVAAALAASIVISSARYVRRAL